jgi:CheY-like chemotaxis protein
VFIDPSQIDQILANLCVNARDAIEDVGRISIETRMAWFDPEFCEKNPDYLSGNFVMLAISDNGCGMDSETRTRIFEPFYTTKSMGQGTGLGLAMVYGIMKQNNGFITVYSEPDKGTTFRLYLPAQTSEVTKDVGRTSSSPPVRGDETILLVEDEPAILKMTAMMLKDLGYTVLTASDPFDAIQSAKKHGHSISLLITDVVMPDMNGRDLADTIRTFHPGLKCLYTSGYTADIIAHHGVLDTGIHFIQKPFSKKNLSDKIRTAIDTP